MDAAVRPRTVSLLQDAVPSLTFSVEYEDGYAYESDFPLGSWDQRFGDGRPPVDSVLGRPCAMLLAYHHTMAADDLYEQVVALVGSTVTPTHSSGRALIEISAVGVTKASALARFATRNGIKPDEAVAFGDMPNDLPMLGWAGTSWAVANAHPDVLAAVDHVTAANDDDGVALVSGAAVRGDSRGLTVFRSGLESESRAMSRKFRARVAPRAGGQPRRDGAGIGRSVFGRCPGRGGGARPWWCSAVVVLGPSW